jgi:hypothetical protein
LWAAATAAAAAAAAGLTGTAVCSGR